MVLLDCNLIKKWVMVSYKKLFKLLIDLDMSKKDLAEKAGSIKKLTKLLKNQKICDIIYYKIIKITK